MKNEEYRTLYNVEDRHWWYIGLRALVHKVLGWYFPEKKGIKLLDAGCGTGGFLSSMKDVEAYGFDMFDEAVGYCEKRGLKNISRGSICDIPFESDSFDVVVSMDVLCDLEEEQDLIALREMKRVLKEGGVLILNLPAYNFLKSTHDKAVSNLNRYTKPEIEEKLLIEGMNVEKISYRNTVLFPIIFAKRIIEKLLPNKTKDPVSELSVLPPLVDFSLSRVLLFENYLLKFLNFSFGLSVFCVARKNSHE